VPEKVSSSSALDPAIYLEPPQLDTAGMLLLGRALMYLAPSPPPMVLLAPLQRLKQAWEELNSAGKSPAIAPGHTEPGGRQPADVAMDNAWTALYERLRAYAMLPELEYPKVRRAHDFMRLLFPDALGFLKLPYEQEWSESGNRLRMVDRLKLTDEIGLLAGPEFLTEVKRAHELYGKVLGIGGGAMSGAVAAESANLRELRSALARSISHYALKVLSISDDDPVQARRLLAPLAEHHRNADKRPSYGRLNADSSPGKLSGPQERLSTKSTSESGSFRLPSDPGPLRAMQDIGSGPHRSDSGIFRVKKPSTTD
jgi:hypothetical protein